MGKILEVNGLSKSFLISRNILTRQERRLKAVTDVSFTIDRGKTLGIVGESGCGKSTLGRCVINLLEPDRGQVFFEGQDITKLSYQAKKALKQQMQIIFQDPFSSLNPRMTVYELLKEPLDNFHQISSKEKETIIFDLMKEVSLPKEYAFRYPHEFSGGQRQRIVIARALILQPTFVVCDEPVSALDVSVQSQVLNLMRRLQTDKNLTYLFISHDLSVVKYMSDEIAVMYLGRIVEQAGPEEIFHENLHPYTKLLISSLPDTPSDESVTVQGEVPSPIDLPKGCSFYQRCPYKKDICQTCQPELAEIKLGHQVACHLYGGNKQND